MTFLYWKLTHSTKGVVYSPIFTIDLSHSCKYTIHGCYGPSMIFPISSLRPSSSVFDRSCDSAKDLGQSERAGLRRWRLIWSAICFWEKQRWMDLDIIFLIEVWWICHYRFFFLMLESMRFWKREPVHCEMVKLSTLDDQPNCKV